MTPHDYEHHYLTKLKLERDHEEDNHTHDDGCLMKFIKMLPCLNIRPADDGGIKILELFTVNH